MARIATVPVDISFHQVLNALERIVRNSDEDGKLRYSIHDMTRLTDVLLEIYGFIKEREPRV